MSQALLSILIPTVIGREEQYNNLLSNIGNQIRDIEHKQINKIMKETGKSSCSFYPPVHIQRYLDNKEKTIGEKREVLYEIAKGKFSWQIDDDDDIAPNAIELILEAIKSNPEVDVISFEEYVNMDGREYKSNHSSTYRGWEGDGNSIFPDGFHFHRTPFFKSVIRTELAKSVPIQKIRFGEDHAFANDLHPLIQSEIHIDKPLYRYIHISSPHNERYGISES